MAYRRGSVQYSTVAHYVRIYFCRFSYRTYRIYSYSAHSVQSCSRPTLPLHHKGVLLLVSRILAAGTVGRKSE
jgi:hypothetical protein